MSKQLLNLVKQFLRGDTPVAEFVDSYIDAWRSERDSGAILEDDPVTSEKLSSIFCVADLYNPENDREKYEFDEGQLRNEVRIIIERKGSFFDLEAEN